MCLSGRAMWCLFVLENGYAVAHRSCHLVVKRGYPNFTPPPPTLLHPMLYLKTGWGGAMDRHLDANPRLYVAGGTLRYWGNRLECSMYWTTRGRRDWVSWVNLLLWAIVLVSLWPLPSDYYELLINNSRPEGVNRDWAANSVNVTASTVEVRCLRDSL